MVAPNPIDFDAAFKGFTDIGSNPVVFATVLTIFGLYFVGVIWARWRDKKDLEKVAPFHKYVCSSMVSCFDGIINSYSTNSQWI